MVLLLELGNGGQSDVFCYKYMGVDYWLKGCFFVLKDDFFVPDGR